MRLLQLSLIGLLATTSSCISIPDISPPDVQRGACIITLPNREICVEVTLLSCFESTGKFSGVGSTCNSPSISVEPTPVYLNETVIYSVGGAVTAIVAAWAGNKAIRRRKKRGVK